MTILQKRKSTGQTVFEEIKNKIISGAYQVGSNLPSERDLVSVLGVSRGAVREALQRLAQSRLVTINHGGGTKVNNFKETAGLDLLNNLIINKNFEIDLPIFRSLIEMRSALGADAAKYAALRRSEEQKEALLDKLEEMKTAEDAKILQQKTIEFWDIIIDASENIAYKLSMNTLKENYSYFERFGTDFSVQNYKFTSYQKLAQAIAGKHHIKAEAAARIVVNRDAEQVESFLKAHEKIITKKD